MARPNDEAEKFRVGQESRIHRQIAFASGVFQNDITTRTLLESLPEGFVIIDSSGTILLTNTLATQMFGYPEGDQRECPLSPGYLRACFYFTLPAGQTPT